MWDRKSGFLFAMLAKEGLECAAFDDVRRVVEFHVSQTELVLPAAGSLGRAFRHRVAGDLA